MFKESWYLREVITEVNFVIGETILDVLFPLILLEISLPIFHSRQAMKSSLLRPPTDGMIEILNLCIITSLF